MCSYIKKYRVIIIVYRVIICTEKCLNEVDIELVVSLYSVLHFAQITLL